MATRQMHLVGYLIAGPTWHNNGGWRHPESDADQALDPHRYERIAQILEEGKFDALFFVDVLTLFDTYQGGFAGQVAGPGQMWFLDPLLLLAAMARKTSHIGLAGTLSTAFYHPFHIARAFATLDHMSAGRAAWNVVTSSNKREAQNFGMDRLMDRAERYDHADEVMEACDALWNSWEADAIIYDRKSGVYADPAKVHYADYQGKWVKTRGPLPTPRSPQGRPVIMQAGSSERGRQFAARWAEVIFTLQHSKADMQAFYADIKTRMAKHGRAPEECIITPAVDIVLGETESIANERAEYLNSLVSAEARGLRHFQWPRRRPRKVFARPAAGEHGYPRRRPRRARRNPARYSCQQPHFAPGRLSLRCKPVDAHVDRHPGDGRGPVARHVRIALLRRLRHLSLDHPRHLRAVRQNGRSRTTTPRHLPH